jgi:hypothetical protein
MNNTLRRPMFRKGGSADSAGTGITSGLQAPRQGYAEPNGAVEKYVYDAETATPEQTMAEVNRLNQPKARSNKDLFIDFGLDLISRPGSGGSIFENIGASGQKAYNQYRTANTAADNKLDDRRSDMFTALLKNQGTIKGSEGGSKMFAKRDNDNAIQGLMSELFQLDAQQKTDQALTDNEFRQKQSTLMLRLQAYTGKNPAVSALYDNKEQADLVIGGIQQEILGSKQEIEITSPTGEKVIVIEGEHASDNPAYLGEETSKRYIQQYNTMTRRSMGLAEGGRAAYAEGEMVKEQMTEGVQEVQPNGDSLSYEELRSRLPGEITDDIVVILSESPQALIDFSELQTQTDVDQFNMKYGVNLALPSGA